MSPLENAARKAQEWTQRRDALIRAAHDDGLSLRAIAAQADLTHAGVAKILKRDLQ